MTDGLANSVLARIAMQRDLMQAMDEHCKSISARVTSRDKSVSVQVDGYGTMTGLWLADSASRHAADVLAKLIVDTANAAAVVAQERQTRLLGEFTKRLAVLQGQPLARRDGTIFSPAQRRTRADGGLPEVLDADHEGTS